MCVCESDKFDYESYKNLGGFTLWIKTKSRISIKKKVLFWTKIRFQTKVNALVKIKLNAKINLSAQITMRCDGVVQKALDIEEAFKCHEFDYRWRRELFALKTDQRGR